jgi:peptide deformylase
MALLTVLTAPDPRLKVVAKPVDQVDDEIRQLMADMLETMYAHDGIGLAAVQVNVAKRVIVMDINFGDESLKPAPLKMANPEILWHSSTTQSLNEGCLSVPGQRAVITRPDTVIVRYLDEYNQVQELQADGDLACCIQHEIDHLDGQLFIDHLSRLKRELILKRVEKFKRRYR